MDFKLTIPRETQKNQPEYFLNYFYNEFSNIFPKSNLSFKPNSKNWYLIGKNYHKSKWLLQNKIFSLLENENLKKSGIELRDYKINFEKDFSKAQILPKKDTIKINEYLTKEEFLYLISNERKGNFKIDTYNCCLKYFDLEPEKKRKIQNELNNIYIREEIKQTLEKKLTSEIFSKNQFEMFNTVTAFMPPRQNAIEENKFLDLLDRLETYNEEQVNLINKSFEFVDPINLPNLLKICLYSEKVIMALSILSLPYQKSGNYIRNINGKLEDL